MAPSTRWWRCRRRAASIPGNCRPGPVTRIDEALCRDFIDLCLAAFSRETRGVEDRDWPERMSFGSRIADPGQLGLLLPDRTYHVLTAAFDAGRGRRAPGQAVLVLPRTRDPVPRAVAASGGMDPEDWRKALEAAMAEAPVDLDAVLVRTTRSLRDLEAMAPGDLIGFDPPTCQRAAGNAVGQDGAARAARPDRRDSARSG
jgi:flagellar motor switch protein FliM